MKTLNTLSMKASAIFMSGFLMSPFFAGDAEAGTGGIKDITQEVGQQVSTIPQLISIFIYITGIAMSAFGVLKIKEHVDGGQTTLKEGLIRLGAGGALLAAPAVFQALSDSVGVQGGLQQNTFDAATTF